MKDASGVFNCRSNRRKFLKNGMVAAGAATFSAGLMSGGLSAFGRERNSDDGAPISKGDIAILQFLSALEQVEEDSLNLAGPRTTRFQEPTAETRCIRRLFRFLTETCRSTFTTTQMMKSATIAF